MSQIAPTSANGSVPRVSSAGPVRWKIKNNNKKMIARSRGMTHVKRSVARSRCSNCPDHAIETPAGG